MVECESRCDLKGVVEVPMGKSRVVSEVAVMDPPILEAAARSASPSIFYFNVTKSSRVHIGPKFVSVTQKIDNNDVVKGQIMGPEMSPKNRILCSIAMFAIWAVLVACVVTFFIFQFALVNQVRRLDIDLPLPVYNTAKAQKISCAVAITILAICIAPIVYFLIPENSISEEPIDPSQEWFITRNMWSASIFNTSRTMDEYEPLALVIISHTAGPECNQFETCAAILNNLQTWYFRNNNEDLPYSFLIGNEGRVYEGRGWNVVGADTGGFDHCSIDIAFTGDYREGLPSYSQVTELQLERAKMLLAQGMELGHLHPAYQMVGARDLKPTRSPGDNIYNIIRQWERYSHENVFRGRTCQEIKSLFEEGSSTTAEPQELEE